VDNLETRKQESSLKGSPTSFIFQFLNPDFSFSVYLLPTPTSTRSRGANLKK